MAAQPPHTFTSIDTRVIHADGHNKPMKSHAMPIFQTSTFVFDSPDHGAALFAGQQQGHIYSRIGNPTVQAFESVCAALEEGCGAVAFGSGMAAVHGATLAFLRQGDHVIVGDTLYGPSTLLIKDVYARWGITSTIVDTSNPANIAPAITEKTKLIYLETPANPTNKITDVRAVAEIAHSHGRNIIVVVDNTFATPIFHRPLALGADLALHSLTKYMNGHGDVVGGVVVGKAPAHVATVRTFRKDTGGIMGPFDAYLVLRGLRTLPIRMERLNRNAIAVARYLKTHAAIDKVMHPVFEDFPNHDVAMRNMTGFGSTFSFTMKGGFDAAKRLLEKVHLCTVAVSLGGFDTLIEHPASMTHASVPEPLMIQQGLTRSLIRISIGLEDPADIIADLEHALAQLN